MITMLFRVATAVAFLCLLSFLNIRTDAKSSLKINQVVIVPIPCGGPCHGPHEICDEELNECVCKPKYIRYEGKCLPERHYGEECMVDEQCVDPRQICNKMCECFPRTVYNETEEECVLPCWFTYDTSPSSGRQYKFGGEEDEVDFAVAKETCQADGAYLPIMMNYQDEVDFIQYKYETGQDMENDIWLGIAQQSRYEYLWPTVNVTLKLGEISGAAIYGGYAHFYDDEANDVSSSSDDDVCLYVEGIDDGFSWEDTECDYEDAYIICECPSREKFDEVFIKGNKDYFFQH